jgi:hypothetical protein
MRDAWLLVLVFATGTWLSDPAQRRAVSNKPRRKLSSAFDKYLMMRRAYLLVLTLLLSMGLRSQSPPAEGEAVHGIRLGIGLDGVSYQGDWHEPGSIPRVQLGGHLLIEGAKPAALKVQACFGFGQVTGQADGPANFNAPSVFFQTRFWYGDLRVSWQPTLGQRWQPMLSLGAGLMHFSPRDDQGRPLSSRTQTRDPGEDYNAFIPQLPIQAGIQYAITEQVAFGLQYTYQFVPSDYLDNTGNRGRQPGFDALQSLGLTMRVTIGDKAPSAGSPPPTQEPAPTKPTPDTKGDKMSARQ